jgi:O-antigen/teichoic acid export membrane protein
MENTLATDWRTESPRRRFAINVLSNIIMLGLNMVVGIWLTPYLIGHLGVASYGLVPLANSVTSYMSVLNAALNSAVGRFLTIDLRRSERGTAIRTFNTAFWGSIGLGIILLPLVVGISAAAPLFFNVPPGQEQATRWLFAAVMTAYLISVVQSVFTVSPFASNRFDLMNMVPFTRLLVRVAMIVSLFALLIPQVWQVGLGTLVGTLAALAVAVVIWRRLTPELSINLRAFDRSRLRDLFGMGGWMTVNQVGSLLFLQIDLIVVNIFLGAEAGGRYGSVLQWSVLLRTLSGAIAGVITPVLLSQYARGDLHRLATTSRQAVKLLGLGMALPVGLVCGLSAPLLSVWLGPEFTKLSLLLIVLTAHLSINLAVRPLFSAQVALNKVKWPGIVTLLMGLLNVVLAVWWVDWGMNGLGVALAGAVVLTIKNTLFTPLYGAHIEGLAWHTYLRSLVPGVLGAVAVGLAGSAWARAFDPSSWFALIGVGLLLSLLYSAFAYALGLNSDDRRLLISLVPTRKA